jgi:hypothetical protein
LVWLFWLESRADLCAQDAAGLGSFFETKNEFCIFGNLLGCVFGGFVGMEEAACINVDICPFV